MIAWPVWLRGNKITVTFVTILPIIP